MGKIKTATLTFHASHNYGSMLQAYALQQVLINELGVENTIINYRSDAQKRMYQSPEDKKHSWKYKIIKPLLIDKKSALIKKFHLFEKFLEEKLDVTPEFNDEKDVIDFAANVDYLITGSDQVWNTHCYDFNWLYYLPFAKGNAIAYAPSMGPAGKNEVNAEYYPRINNCLRHYKSISVREQGTADIIKSISDKDVDILIDPTLLINKETWDKLSGDEPIIKGDYIFMYHPFINNQIYQITKDISQKTGLPVYISNQLPYQIELNKIYSGKRNLRYKLDAGPIEFLNLLKNAKLVISGSFHAVVFSIIFNKPFLAVNGKTDNRMSQLLRATNLLEYGVNEDDYLIALHNLSNIDFTKAALYIKKERENSLTYLNSALEL